MARKSWWPHQKYTPLHTLPDVQIQVTPYSQAVQRVGEEDPLVLHLEQKDGHFLNKHNSVSSGSRRRIEFSQYRYPKESMVIGVFVMNRIEFPPVCQLNFLKFAN